MFVLFAVATWKLGAMAALGFSGVAGLGALAWKLGDKKEAISKRFVKSAAFFEGLGFKYLPEGLLCLGTNDLSGAMKAVTQFDDMLEDEAALQVHMEKITLTMAGKLMDDNPAFCEALKAKVDGVFLVEEAQRKAEAEVQEAKLLRDQQKLDQQLARRAAEQRLQAADSAAPLVMTTAAKPVA